MRDEDYKIEPRAVERLEREAELLLRRRPDEPHP